jgi:hypothetical protein
MLKRAAALLLSLLYLITATGFALNLHFCGDSITAVTINTAAKAPAGCADGMKCCTNKHLLVKVKDVHVAQPHVVHAKVLAFTIAPFCYSCFSFTPKQGLPGQFVNKPPPDPPLANVDVFLKNRVFLI